MNFLLCFIEMKLSGACIAVIFRMSGDFQSWNTKNKFWSYWHECKHKLTFTDVQSVKAICCYSWSELQTHSEMTCTMVLSEYKWSWIPAVKLLLAEYTLAKTLLYHLQGHTRKESGTTLRKNLLIHVEEATVYFSHVSKCKSLWEEKTTAKVKTK